MISQLLSSANRPLLHVIWLRISFEYNSSNQFFFHNIFFRFNINSCADIYKSKEIAYNMNFL